MTDPLTRNKGNAGAKVLDRNDKLALTEQALTLLIETKLVLYSVTTVEPAELLELALRNDVKPTKLEWDDIIYNAHSQATANTGVWSTIAIHRNE